MKKAFCALLATILFTLSPKAQIAQEVAKNILDNTTASFRTNGGIQADFSAKTFYKNQLAQELSGALQLKGEKFVLETDKATIWFDGKIQWSYWKNNNEVNITTTTAEELQSINPYALLSSYQKKYNYEIGTVKQFQGKSVYEIILISISKQQEISRIRLYITKDSSYQPVYIIMEQREGNNTEITIIRYQTKQRYDDSIFAFDAKRYSGLDIIDLR
jgi:outer membrane lipoprotein-sorting protein